VPAKTGLVHTFPSIHTQKRSNNNFENVKNVENVTKIKKNVKTLKKRDSCYSTA